VLARDVLTLAGRPIARTAFSARTTLPNTLPGRTGQATGSGRELVLNGHRRANGPAGGNPSMKLHKVGVADQAVRDA
jgi:hypothetical protein